MAENMPSEEVTRLLNRFYAVATDVLLKQDALVDKLMGDDVMALFLTGVTGPGCFAKMASAAEGILQGVGFGSAESAWLPVGVGLDFGLAFVGNVGAGDVKDFTAIGDVVNTAARLQAEARGGQIVMSDRVYQEVSSRYRDARAVQLGLKGKSGPTAARVVEIPSALGGAAR